ncbi:MAG: hypothetical protein ACI4J7_10665, partial [Ruminiclostridium sp.]
MRFPSIWRLLGSLKYCFFDKLCAAAKAAASPPFGASRLAARSAALCGGFAAFRRFAPCRAERGTLRRLRRLSALRALPRGAR